MDNLIEQATIWLRSKDCQEGSVVSRSRVVLSFFKAYLKANRDELEAVSGEKLSGILGQVDKSENSITRLLTSYLRGNHANVHRIIFNFLSDMKMCSLSKNTRLYRGRKAESNYLFSKDEMFHLPFEKRSRVDNQRFSVSGIPCLYLGGSSYVCWEELDRVDFSRCNFCGYMNTEDVSIFDLALPTFINSLSEVKRVSLILCCSLKANRESFFKEEYILPQIVLLDLIRRTYYSHQQFGVRYISSHQLDGDSCLFQCDYNNDQWVKRFFNYVFPAASSQDSGYNEQLRKQFVQTETTTMQHAILLRPDRLVTGDSNDVYLDSQFGLMDAILDEKMGVRSLRKETALMKRSAI